MTKEVLVEAKGISKHFVLKRGILSIRHTRIRAVSDVNLKIETGEVVGLVGESGSGKTTTGRMLIGLWPLTKGSVHYRGRNLVEFGHREMLKLRQRMQIVFQDPYGSLNPKIKVGEAIGEPLDIHQRITRKEKKDRVLEIMETVGLLPQHFQRYPHEFSGGQRQRIGIARALILKPEFIVCDEPVSALDVSIQSQILNLLLDLQSMYELTYLFISHDLRVVRYLCDRVAVMYLGKIIEEAKAEELFHDPRHPYTQALVSAIPKPKYGTQGQRIILQGDIPNPSEPPSGCYLHPRCRLTMDVCKRQQPSLFKVTENHSVACWREA